MNERSTQRPLDLRRNEALAVFRDTWSVERLGSARVRRLRDRVSMTFADGSEALIHIASHKAGLPAGEFELFPTLIIRGGPVRSVIDSLHLDPGSAFRDEKILLVTLRVNGGRQDVFTFRHGTDIQRQARRMSLAIERRFLPLVTAFTGDYSRAARFVAAEPPWVALPWCTATTLFELAGDEAGLDDLRVRAEVDPGSFPDLALIPDPTSLAGRIRKAVRAIAPDNAR